MQPQHYYSVALQLIEPATVDYSAFLFKAQRIASSIQSHDFFAVPMGINGFYWFCSQPQQNSRRFAVFRFFVHVDDDFNWDHVASCRLFYSELCPFDKDDPTCNCDAHRMYQQVLTGSLFLKTMSATGRLRCRFLNTSGADRSVSTGFPNITVYFNYEGMVKKPS